MNTEQKIAALEREVADLKRWKAERMRQQITFPLDKQSIEILNKYFMRLTGQTGYQGGVSGRLFLLNEGIQDNQRFFIEAELIEYVADPSTDVIRILYPGTNTTFTDGNTLSIYSSDTEPGGLSGSGLTTYHVVNAASDGNSFKLSATSGGAAINITSEGVGRQFIIRS